jgi:membrane-associated protein
MFDGLLELVSGSSATYGIVLGVAAVDALLPVMPSEAVVVSAGALAGTGRLSFACVIGAAAFGAIAGDNGAYSLGRLFGPTLERRIAGSERARKRRDWAERKLHAGGGRLLLASRFVPGGRTAATLTAGIVRLRWTRFLLLTLAAGSAWACGMGLLGYVGGNAVERNPSVGVALVGGAGAALLAAIWLGGRIRRRPAIAGVRLAMPPMRAGLCGPRVDA